MKAAFLYGPSDLRVETVAVPSISDREALMKVKVVGVCPSDVRTYQGIYKHMPFPYGRESYGLSGHEWAGEVVEIGKSVRDLSLGDLVVPEIIVPCGLCRACMKGMMNLCRNKGNLERGYAEYAKAPSNLLFKVPDGVSPEEAAFAEPIAVCLHTNEIISPKPGETVLIIGGGPMGLIHTQITKLSGAKVVVSELVESRLKTAWEYGADVTVDPLNEDLAAKVKGLTDGYGADAVICATGAKSAIESAFKAVAVAGKIVLFGGTYPPTDIQVDPNIIHYGEICVTGSYDHLPIHMLRALKLMSSDALNVTRLVSNTFALDWIREAFELVRAGKALKVQVKP